MDIEHLTKTQIILLTLLTSFVTSIATGIVTVSLMDQAPPAIAQTVNRVVERTIEKVVPQVQTASAVQTQTVVIKESDLISQAIEEVRPSIVRLYSSAEDSSTFLGLGVVLTGGAIIADSSALGEAGDAVAEQSGGLKVRAFVSRRDEATGFAYLQAATSSVDGKSVAWTGASLVRGKTSLGQTIFTIYGKNAFRVSDGIVTALEDADGGAIIDTDISGDSMMPGSPLIDTDGKIVGISSGISRTSAAAAYMPASSISLEAKTPEKK